MTLFISEVLQLVHEAKTRQEKVLILKKNNSPQLREVLNATYNRKFVQIRKPKYAPDNCPLGCNPNHLFQAHKSFYLFEEGTQIPEDRLKRALIQLLESMHHLEGEVFLTTMKGKITLNNKAVKGLTKALVKEAFPGLFEEDEEDGVTKSENQNVDENTDDSQEDEVDVSSSSSSSVEIEED